MPINVTIDLGEAFDKVSEARQRKAQLETPTWPSEVECSC